MDLSPNTFKVDAQIWKECLIDEMKIKYKNNLFLK